MIRVFEHNNQSWTGYALGFIGGIGKYISQLGDASTLQSKLFEAALTGIITAVLGKVAIDCYVWSKKKIISYFKK